jgi:hypothetical protein
MMSQGFGGEWKYLTILEPGYRSRLWGLYNAGNRFWLHVPNNCVWSDIWRSRYRFLGR